MPSRQGYLAESPALQLGLTCAINFVDLMCLSSRGPSMHGYRTESPIWQLGLTCASSFVNLTCLGSRGHLNLDSRAKSA